MRNKVELKNGTVLEVGKKYTQSAWLKHEVLEVVFIGKEVFFAIDEENEENIHPVNNDWIPYEEPKAEKWYEYLYLSFDSKEETAYKLYYSNRPKLANVIYLREWDSKEEMIEDLKK